MYEIYGTESCTYCKEAMKLLDLHDLDYTYTDIRLMTDVDKDTIQKVARKVFRTVPQIFKVVGNDLVYVGGYTDLKDDLKKDE